MASAVLNNRNEFMGKLPFSKSNPNPKRHYHEPAGDINGYQNVESPAMTQSASDDASSINRRSNEFVPSQYVRFNIASYSRKELFDLKNRFTYELERIRRLNNRIETNEFQVRSSYNNVPPAKKSINKKLSGHKRPFPSSFPKDSKRLNPDNANLIKLCGQILTKLVKHKHAWIFKTPVDVVGDGLHDYYDIIKNPMDLGTVKSNLAKNLYSSPLDFASDVRLTFNNAMLYNPKGHDVYAMAEQLLARFEELFRPVNEKLVVEEPQERVYDEELQENSWNPPTTVPETENAMHIERKMEQTRVPAIASNPPSVQSVRTPSPMRVPAVKPVKQPKPKAKDPNKREMSMEEKHRLGTGLQSLPQEKMEQVVQIISKRNGHLSQDGDEIELDIETVDTETLWELDRFVTNYKKWVSKMKRQELMGINMNPIERNVELPETQRIEIASEAKKQKKGDVGDEDVDIGDDIPVSNFPPVEIEKDDGRASGSSSSSSSSSSGSSSGSDSDSGSSSGSDSDADDARS